MKRKIMYGIMALAVLGLLMLNGCVKPKPICKPDCTCANRICKEETCSNGCGGTCQGLMQECTVINNLEFEERCEATGGTGLHTGSGTPTYDYYECWCPCLNCADRAELTNIVVFKDVKYTDWIGCL